MSRYKLTRLVDKTVNFIILTILILQLSKGLFGIYDIWYSELQNLKEQVQAYYEVIEMLEDNE